MTKSNKINQIKLEITYSSCNTKKEIIYKPGLDVLHLRNSNNQGLQDSVSGEFIKIPMDGFKKFLENEDIDKKSKNEFINFPLNLLQRFLEIL